MEYYRKHLTILSVAALIAGILLALVIPQFFAAVSFIGDIYVNLLKLLVVPLLMAQIFSVSYASNARVPSRIVKTVLLFIVMFVCTFLLTALVVGIMKPGNGANLIGEEWTGTVAAASVSSFFKSIIPDNLFAAMANGSLLPCILISFALGFAAKKTKADKAAAVIDDFGKAFSKLLDWIMLLTPVGVFVLIGKSTADNGIQLAGVCAKYILTAWALCAASTIVVMILPVWIFAKISPITYIKRVSRIWMITLSTCSSAATLPNTVKVCNDQFGISHEITDVVVPLGCTIHMCGGAVSFCLLGFFTMQMTGTPITVGLFFTMLVIATLMNMAAPGIPGGGIALGAAYLTILGASTGFIGMYSGIYRLLDMVYTSLNVTGDITVNILIAKAEKERIK